jgi:Tfp pilus assembly protein PilN
MMRINLLPPEILERRRAEKGLGYVVVAALGVAVVLAAVWAWAHFTLEGKKSDLASVQQQVAQVKAQADTLAVFEQRSLELDARRAVVQTALGGRTDWPKLFHEISLVLPSDIWLTRLSAAEGSTIQFDGFAVDAPKDNPDAGHKAIAKALVRLADLDQLFDVWLLTSSETEFENQPAIQFTITAMIRAADAAATETGGAAQ